LEKPRMYRLRHNPHLIVEKLCDSFQRTGAILKQPAVTYRSLHDNEVTTRAQKEFERMFEPLKE
jgi:hypothetical protein